METSWTNHGADKIALKVWILRIAGARPADSGLYQCQVLLMMLMVKIVIKMIMIFIMIILIFHHFSACWVVPVSGVVVGVDGEFLTI